MKTSILALVLAALFAFAPGAEARDSKKKHDNRYSYSQHRQGNYDRSYRSSYYGSRRSYARPYYGSSVYYGDAGYYDDGYYGDRSYYRGYYGDRGYYGSPYRSYHRSSAPSVRISF